MMKPFVFVVFLIVFAAAFVWGTEVDETTTASADEAGYVERTEEVRDAYSGRTRVERVVEFAELQIEPTLARPISLIIPRNKPDFDSIHLTIYNNEPPACVPEELKSHYYRRVKVDEAKADDKTVDAAFTPEGSLPSPQKDTPANATEAE